MAATAHRAPQGVPGTQQRRRRWRRQRSVERGASVCLTAGLLWKFRWAPSCLGYMLKLKLNSAHTCSHTHTRTHAELNLAAAARMRNPFSHVQNFLAKVFASKLLMMKMREKRKAKKCGEHRSAGCKWREGGKGRSVESSWSGKG